MDKVDVQVNRQGVTDVVGVPARQHGRRDQLFTGLLVPHATLSDGADGVKGPADVGQAVVARVVADGRDVDADLVKGKLGGGFVGEAQEVGRHGD